MDWKKYENEIFEEFKLAYPGATVLYNQYIVGKHSKVKRQIDILVEFKETGGNIKLIIDGKYLNKKVDVKEVDSFISMAEDVGANQGILVTNEGFSKGAVNRAHYGSRHIELDILNFKELKKFQGFIGIPYTGGNCVILPAPFGWVLDIDRRDFPCLAFLYQRGLTLDEAINKNEWMYINFWDLKNGDTSDSLLKHQMENFDGLSPQIEELPTVKRGDAKTLLRKVTIDSYPCPEYTGYVEFEDFIFFAVMFTPPELEKKNIRKLENIMSRITPGGVIMELENS